MDAKQFQIEADRTAIPVELFAAGATPELQKTMRLLNGVLGMIDEATELLDEVARNQKDTIKIRKEIGDVYWYAAHICVTEGWQLEHYTPMAVVADTLYVRATKAGVNLHTLADSLVVQTGKLAGLTKKVVFHRHAADETTFKQQFKIVLLILNHISRMVGSTEGEVMQLVSDKLRARYPEKFETHLSENKDESKE